MSTPTARPTSLRWVVGLAVLLVLGATCAATLGTRDQIKDTQEARLDYESRQVDAELRERMQAYVQILWGGVAFFLASTEVSRGEWVDYVATLRLNDRYPGFKSLSFAAAVPDDEIDAFVDQVRRSPVPADIIDPALIREFTRRQGLANTLEEPPALTEDVPMGPIVWLEPVEDETRRAQLWQRIVAGDRPARF